MTYLKKTTDELTTLFLMLSDYTGLGQSIISKKVAKDSTFYTAMTKGTNFGLKKADIIAANFFVIWPSDKPWPKSVGVPDASLATIQPEKEEA